MSYESEVQDLLSQDKNPDDFNICVEGNVCTIIPKYPGFSE